MAQEDVKIEENNELEELKAKCEEYLAGWKRERADFVNFKKDESERLQTMIKFANEGMILKLLPVLDHLLLAQQHINDDGLAQVIKQFAEMLKKEGIEEIEVLGKPFDPNIMEAIEEVEKSGVPDSAEAGTVVEEAQKGYTLNGKVIRPAMVKISK